MATPTEPCRRCEQRPVVPGAVRWYLVPGLLASSSMAMSWFHPGLIGHSCKECGGKMNGVGMVATAIVLIVAAVMALVWFS